jgi:predicted GTPase
MLDEIIEIYTRQLYYYKDIERILNKVSNEEFDIANQQIEFENVEFILGKIKLLNEKAEQMKPIYISKNRIQDFVGNEIKKLESESSYNNLRVVIDNLTSEIVAVKKLQDSIVKKVSDNSDTVKKILFNTKPDKNAVQKYKANSEK